MEKVSRKLVFLVTFLLVATGFPMMNGIAEAKGAAGPPSCTVFNYREDCQPYCSFFHSGTGLCVDNVCKCIQGKRIKTHN